MNIFATLFAFIVAITFHEFAHAWMAKQLGDPTAQINGRLSFNPLASVNFLQTLFIPILLILMRSPVIFGAAKPVPFNPNLVRWGKRGAALVALAGPVANFILILVASVYYRLLHINLESVSGKFLLTFVGVNLGLGIFNLIPFPPLDGSRIVYAFAPEGLRDIFDRIERMGMLIFLPFIFIVWPMVSGPIQTLQMRILVAIFG